MTSRISICVAGTFAPKRSVMPSSGWMRSTSALAPSSVVSVCENGRCGARFIISAISVKNNSASVSFSYLKDGKVAFIPFYGSLTRISGVWVVDRNAICQLASQVAVATC